ncbi:N-6 DNA methylase [Vibrio jasicida]|uniref:class I SAM-dependent DNA methyltransferase n=1 Tax=Vibrio jasicida TaxID=766224 RepID=UPI0005F0B5CF|nr:N-6 DNA methylase [Vibrio jasicida]
MNHNDIVQKLWNLCDVLRDDGINYSDYVTELVFLLFLKMTHEQNQADTKAEKQIQLPEGCRWTDIADKSGVDLLNDYKEILLDLSKSSEPLLQAIYADAQTRIREPKHLEQLVKAFNEIDDWFDDESDGFGDLYEGLLQKNATETKSGAGQYFTPRALIDSIVRCIKPQPGETIQDPAAGTAGFLISASQYIYNATDEYFDLNDTQKNFQKYEAFIGVELVPSTRRLALMNCLLHNMVGGQEGVVKLGNALGDAGKSLPAADIILANPPFGTSKGGDASISRTDLTFKTSNKQLAFLQHIYRNLKPGGRAAVVLPDNVLFEAGVGTEVRRDLMEKCNLHTILRLPSGIFYAQGVKTNVLFFTKPKLDETDKPQKKTPEQIEADRKAAKTAEKLANKDKTDEQIVQEKAEADKIKRSKNATQNIWVYDLRTNMPSFGKRNPFSQSHLTPFETVYGDNADGTSVREQGEWSFGALTAEVATDETESVNEGVSDKLAHSRWRCFSREWIFENKGDSLDISWLKDKDAVDASCLPSPVELATKAKKHLNQGITSLDVILAELGEAE